MAAARKPKVATPSSLIEYHHLRFLLIDAVCRNARFRWCEDWEVPCPHAAAAPHFPCPLALRSLQTPM